MVSGKAKSKLSGGVKHYCKTSNMFEALLKEDNEEADDPINFDFDDDEMDATEREHDEKILLSEEDHSTANIKSYFHPESLIESVLSEIIKKAVKQSKARKQKQRKRKVELLETCSNNMDINKFDECNVIEEKIESTQPIIRCRSCNIKHFPYQKFCRWTRSRGNKITQPLPELSTISEENVKLIHEWILRIEVPNEKLNCKSHGEHLKITETFLERTQGSMKYPDLCFHVAPKKDLKLKGGSRVKKFDTEDEEIVKMLTLFRSLSVFGEFEDHKICKISSKNPKESLCYCCLMRSTVFKSRIGKGRQLLKPVEILCNIPEGIRKVPTYEIVNTFLEHISKCIPNFKDKVATNWICSGCKVSEDLTDKYCINLDEKTNSLNIENPIEMKTRWLQNEHICQDKHGHFQLSLHKIKKCASFIHLFVWILICQNR